MRHIPIYIHTSLKPEIAAALRVIYMPQRLEHIYSNSNACISESLNARFDSSYILPVPLHPRKRWHLVIRTGEQQYLSATDPPAAVNYLSSALFSSAGMNKISQNGLQNIPPGLCISAFLQFVQNVWMSFI
jgi:hypothetical protein